jgi:hypothetical protein
VSVEPFEVWLDHPALRSLLADEPHR